MEIQKWLEPCLMPVEEEVSECLRTSPPWYCTAWSPLWHIRSYLFICIYIYKYKVCVHTFVRTYVRTYRQTDSQTDMHTYIHTYIRTYIHTYDNIHIWDEVEFLTTNKMYHSLKQGCVRTWIIAIVGEKRSSRCSSDISEHTIAISNLRSSGIKATIEMATWEGSKIGRPSEFPLRLSSLTCKLG
jgi:hypothetical protein